MRINGVIKGCQEGNSLSEEKEVKLLKKFSVLDFNSNVVCSVSETDDLSYHPSDMNTSNW